MRIAMVNHGYRPVPPDSADSPALVIDQLSTALTRRGLIVVTVSGGASPRRTRYKRFELRPPRLSKSGGPVFAEGLFALDVRRSISRIQPDIIHHHASTPAALGIRPSGIPVVMSYAAPLDTSGRVPTWGSLSGISKLIERMACRRTDHITVPSLVSEKFLRTVYGVPRRRITNIPNGVDTSFFAPSVHEPADQALLCVARLSPYKDQATLLAAFAHPELAGRGARLVLAGPETDPAYGRSLRRMAADLGIASSVEFVGHIAFDRLPDLYRSASVVAAPSRAEAMPLALLEAMSCGRPIVASAIPQHLALGSGAGISFVPSGDSRAMAAAISQLLDDPQARSDAGIAARRVAVEQYSWEAVAERFELLYRGLIA